MSLRALDTDICIYALNGRPPEVGARLSALEAEPIGVPTAVIAELRYAALNSARVALNMERHRAFLGAFEALPFDEAAAHYFGELKHALATTGQLIGLMDMVIAATALAHDATLVTNNMREFSRVPGLRLENWTEPRG
ncbi:MAG: type II toxin-antitoxin system VapC family toxin [Dehalococcoidia bacterium]